MCYFIIIIRTYTAVSKLTYSVHKIPPFGRNVARHPQKRMGRRLQEIQSTKRFRRRCSFALSRNPFLLNSLILQSVCLKHLFVGGNQERSTKVYPCLCGRQYSNGGYSWVLVFLRLLACDDNINKRLYEENVRCMLKQPVPI